MLVTCVCATQNTEIGRDLGFRINYPNPQSRTQQQSGSYGGYETVEVTTWRVD